MQKPQSNANQDDRRTAESFGVIYSYAYTHAYTCRMNHNDIMIRDERRLLLKNICTSNFICKVRKGCMGFYCERELETEQKLQYFDPHSYSRQRCVFLVLQGCSTGGPGSQSASFFYYVLFSNFSGPQLNRGPRASLAWCDFPYHISSITRLISNCNCLTSVLTELYNSSMAFLAGSKVKIQHWPAFWGELRKKCLPPKREPVTSDLAMKHVTELL